MARRILPLAAVLALTAAGFLRFPGHTWLQQDMQIYMPILERLWDPAVFRHEPIAERPHVRYTIYDETALLGRRITGGEFREAVVFEQLLFRAAGIGGAYLVATGMGFTCAPALLVAAVYSLGATIAGPSVLTFEYEPVPRGFAVLLVMLALGLMAHRQVVWACLAASFAFLYHIPAAYPFWGAWCVWTAWPKAGERRRERLYGLALLGVAAVLLFGLSRLQPAGAESQDFFHTIGPAHEKLQRMRASYNWVSMWPASFFRQHLFVWLFGLAALWRVRSRLAPDLRAMALGLPLIGMLSIPASYLLLEQAKWTLIPQLQPARALLYATVVAVVMGAAAALHAAAGRRWWEPPLWLTFCFAVPMQALLFQLPPARLGLAAGLAAFATIGLLVWERRRLAGIAVLCAAMAAPIWLIPAAGKVRNYPALHHAELEELAAWARGSTPRDAVFLFPDAGKALHPGIFRAKALRAVYVDWKGGGQINFLREFTDLWWERWQATMAKPFDPAQTAGYAARGIGYFVLGAPNRLPEWRPVFANAKYEVYAVAGPAR